MAAAAEEEAAARPPAARPTAGSALWRLPEELLLLICSYLDMRALGRLAQVCRWLRRFTSCDLLWRRIARASLNSGFTRLGTDLMPSVPVKERVKVSQNWRLGRCREGILLKWRCSQMPWMQLEDDSLYVSQANFILAYQFRPDGASLNRRPLGVFAGHDEDVCHFVLANSHIISAGGDGKIGIHKTHSTFTVKYSAHEQEVNCVDCKGGIIVSGSRDRTAKLFCDWNGLLWALLTPENLGPQQEPAHPLLTSRPPASGSARTGTALDFLASPWTRKGSHHASGNVRGLSHAALGGSRHGTAPSAVALALGCELEM